METTTAIEQQLKLQDPVNLSTPIQTWLNQTLKFEGDESISIAKLLTDQKYTILGHLTEVEITDVNLKDYGINAGRDRARILQGIKNAKASLHQTLSQKDESLKRQGNEIEELRRENKRLRLLKEEESISGASGSDEGKGIGITFQLDDKYRPFCILEYYDVDTSTRNELRCVVATGSTKSFICAEAPYNLIKEKDIDSLHCSFGTAMSYGYISGKILGEDVVIKCYGLAPDSKLKEQNIHVLIGTKSCAKLGLEVVFTKTDIPIIRFSKKN